MQRGCPVSMWLRQLERVLKSGVANVVGEMLSDRGAPEQPPTSSCGLPGACKGHEGQQCQSPSSEKSSFWQSAGTGAARRSPLPGLSCRSSCPGGRLGWIIPRMSPGAQGERPLPQSFQQFNAHVILYIKSFHA